MDKSEEIHPAPKIYADLINGAVEQLIKKEWLGDAKEFPEIQTDLDALKEAVKCVSKDTKKLLSIVEAPQNELIIEKRIKPLVQKLSRHYSRIAQSLGKISFDIDARFIAQSIHNADLEPYQQETMASAKEIAYINEIRGAQRELYDNIRDVMDAGSKKDSNKPDEYGSDQPIIEWFGRNEGKKMNGELLEDIAGFKEVCKQMGKPIEAKLHTLEYVLANIAGIVAAGGELFSNLNAELSGKRESGR